MEVARRELWGSDISCWELSISADDPQPAAKLLKAAGKLVKELDAGAVDVSGIHWRGDPIDTYTLIVYAHAL